MSIRPGLYCVSDTGARMQSACIFVTMCVLGRNQPRFSVVSAALLIGVLSNSGGIEAEEGVELLASCVAERASQAGGGSLWFRGNAVWLFTTTSHRRQAKSRVDNTLADL